MKNENGEMNKVGFLYLFIVVCWCVGWERKQDGA